MFRPFSLAETCSCSLCNKLYTYLYHHIVVLDKYIHSNLVYYKHNEYDEPYDILRLFCEISSNIHLNNDAVTVFKFFDITLFCHTFYMF